MTDEQLSRLLNDLRKLTDEPEWAEFKVSVDDPEMIGKRMSGLANSAALSGRTSGYMVWGLHDETHAVVGTTFHPQRKKGKGGEALVNWLTRLLTPQVPFQFHTWAHDGHAMVLLDVGAATHQPVSFEGVEYIRIDSHTKPLKAHPAKESALWDVFRKSPFERGIAKADLDAAEVYSLIEAGAYFDPLKLPAPTTQASGLEQLVEDKVVMSRPGGRWDITNMGAVLFAKDLGKFDRISRKAIRVVKYVGKGKTDTEREWRDPPSHRGYAAGAYEAAISFINSQSLHKEPIGPAFREEVRMYPEVAIRELVANALVHQDFTVTGTGPVVAMFADRIEITNPGESLVDTKRFINNPPKSRNEALAALMRRMKICEEEGTGIDKVIRAVEQAQLPPPDFDATTGFTKAILFARRKLSEMSKAERVRACYQHACLRWVERERMTNTSLRERFDIDERNAAVASRIIAEAVRDGLVRPYDPDAGKRYVSYVPAWA